MIRDVASIAIVVIAVSTAFNALLGDAFEHGEEAES